MLFLAAVVTLSLVDPLSGQTMVLDDFETLQGWKAIHTHGEGSSIVLRSELGKTGQALCMDFEFMGYMGGVMAQKEFPITLPSNYQFVFDLKGDAPVNNLEFRLVDSLGNVWWYNRFDYSFPRTWTTIRIKKRQIPYAWGPSWGGDARHIARIEFNIAVTTGGKGKVWIDNFRLEAVDERSSQPYLAGVTASSSRKGFRPSVGTDGKSVGPWWSAGKKEESLTLRLERYADLGGMVIDWDSLDHATSFDVLLSPDGEKWEAAYHVRDGNGGREYVPIGEREAAWVKFVFIRSQRGAGYHLRSLALKGGEFSASPNALFQAIAEEAPPGFYPKYLQGAQSYWTLVGTSGDLKEALMNEQGMIETDRLNFSLEPFLMVDSSFVTWHDVKTTPSLDDGYLPIPTVRWDFQNRVHLGITALSSGRPDSSTLLVRYLVANKGPRPETGKLFVALRPLQVNPPWQVFTIVGGTARVDSISCGNTIRVNTKEVVPVSRPSACGAASFNQGDITRYMKAGRVPARDTVHDSYGYASAALQYDWKLDPGDSAAFIVAVPFHHTPETLPARVDAREAGAFFDGTHQETDAFWRKKLDNVRISLPPSALPVENTIKSNLAYILINKDGPALQPGSRAYERSWIRDGSLIAEALLQMGVRQEVREYIDWYAKFQRADGFIPPVVDPRGPEAVPEHDSHGQFIYMIMQYFRFSGDTTWLRGKWSQVLKTVRYIESLRAQRMTEPYRSGTSEQRALYGLVPQSISHEGYSGNPMHSYWDNFFALRGLKDAAAMAGVLGDNKHAEEFRAETEDYRNAIAGSIRLAMANKNVKDIPGCADLGDEGGLSNTIIVTPVQEVESVPRSGLENGFDRFWRDFQNRKANATQWWAYLPYEWRFVGAFVQTGRKDRALELFEYLMHDRRPAEWNEWAESVWKDPTAPKSIGDMPHAWVGSDFIRAVRSMFVYERERDEALVLGAGIPEAWWNDPAGVAVEGLPTYYGNLNYSMRRSDGRLIVEVGGNVSVPRGGIVLTVPQGTHLAPAEGHASVEISGGEILVKTVPARLEFTF